MRSLWPFLLLTLMPPALAGQGAPLPPSVVARIDSLFVAYDRPGSPGYAIGVVRGGELVFARGYGRANLDYNLPITSRTAFHLASLSKQFTAAAVALLIQEGRLSLDTPVARYIPQAARYGPGLQLKHLIYFTSGLHEYFALPRPNGDPWFSSYYFTIDDALAAALAPDTLKFSPGTRWDYSNTDYMVLARIVELVSGQSLAAFLRERIFQPLGMTGTHLDDDATLVVPNRATGYARRDDPEVRRALAGFGIWVRPDTGYIRLVRTSPHYGGSGVFSTLEDLARWDANFSDGRVGGPGFLRLMRQRTRFAHDKDNDAFGQVFGSWQGQEMIWFAGGDLDASTYMARLPGPGLSVYCLSNLTTGDAEGHCHAVLEILSDGGLLNRR